MARQAKETAVSQRRSTPWTPITEMARWEREMERMLGHWFSGKSPSLFDDRSREDDGFGVREPSIDLYEENDQIVVKAELPGMTKDDIQVTVADNVLTIRGEKKKEEEDRGRDYYRAERVYGAFVRTLPLPAEINPAKIQALFKNGVLEIRLPKSEEAKKKAIDVKVES